MKKILFIAMLMAMPLYAQEEDYGFKADDVDRSIFESDPVFESSYEGEAFKRGNGNGNGHGQGGNGNGNNGNGNGNSGDAPIDNGIIIFTTLGVLYGIYAIRNIKNSDFGKQKDC